MKKDIVLFGIQGSGKGTQAELLMKKLQGYQYFEPGQIFRALKSNNNILGEHIRDRMDQGQMLDDAIVFGVFDIYHHLLADKHMLLDGFLRTLDQMYYFLNKEYMYKRDFIAIHYDLSRDEAINRISIRSKTENRKDDNDASIKTRLDIYENETQPVIDYLDSLSKVIHINANQSIENIHNETLAKLQEKGLL